MSYGDFGKVLEMINSTLGTNLDPKTTEAVDLEFQGNKLKIQTNETRENVLVIADLGEVPPGRYRQDVLKQALRANGYPPPNIGILGFSERSEHLYLFASYPVYAFTKEKLKSILEPFVMKVQLWTDALKSSVVPIVTKPQEGGVYTRRYADTIEQYGEKAQDLGKTAGIGDILGKFK
ncbi:MAG: CesT family type III secretion system chaperone [Chlamydiia bacterium]|nr:CesT family type III secretion system chaperone [Chlamydiia bacterium]